MISKVKTEKFEMNYMRFGNGKRVLTIIPGVSVKNVTLSANAVETAFAVLKDDFTVYLFDRVESPKDGYTIKDMALDTIEAMRSVGIEKTDIYCASQGGMIAMNIALFSPNLVNKMVLASTSAYYREGFKKVCENWLCLAQKGDKFGLADYFAEIVYSKETYDANKEAFHAMGESFEEEDLKRFITFVKAFETIDIEGEIQNIKATCLFVTGRCDKVFSQNECLDSAEKIGAKSYVYEGNYGHGVYDEAPDFPARIREFLLK